jgi:hypothetical protein
MCGALEGIAKEAVVAYFKVLCHGNLRIPSALAGIQTGYPKCCDLS